MSLKGAVEAFKVLRGKVKDFFVIDATLSISGACAEASAVGEALGLKADKTEIEKVHTDLENAQSENADALNEKVSFTDITDNLTTEDKSLPLSAKQGFVLKGLIDSINKFAMEDKGEVAPEAMSELDDIIGNGFYSFDSSLLTNSNSTLDRDGYLFTYQFDAIDTRIQEYISELGSKCRRYYDGTAWGEWEWENPPMAVDTEYRTTERWLGDPVYTRLLSIGQLPTAESAKEIIYHSFYDEAGTQIYTGDIIRTSGVMRKLDGTDNSVLSTRNIPSSWYEWDSANNQTFKTVDVTTSEYQIVISANADYSGYNASVQIWYTKEAV